MTSTSTPGERGRALSFNDSGALSTDDLLWAEIEESGAFPECRPWARLCEATKVRDPDSVHRALLELRELCHSRRRGDPLSRLDLYVDEHTRMPAAEAGRAYFEYKRHVISASWPDAEAALAAVERAALAYLRERAPR